MKYRTLAHEKLEDLARDFLGKERLEPTDLTATEAVTVPEGSGASLDLRPLKKRVKEMERLHRDLLENPDFKKDPDRIEGRLAPLLHQGLKESQMPDEVLDSSGFWRYLVMANFWWFVAWRHSGAFKEGGTYMRYLDHKKHELSVLARMYIRADLALDEEGSYELSWAGTDATDIWQSHLIPVKTGFSPVLVRAFLRRQAKDPKNTPTIREIAKLIRRSNTNVVHTDWDDNLAEAFIDHHWSHPSLKTLVAE